MSLCFRCPQRLLLVALCCDKMLFEPIVFHLWGYCYQSGRLDSLFGGLIASSGPSFVEVELEERAVLYRPFALSSYLIRCQYHTNRKILYRSFSRKFTRCADPPYTRLKLLSQLVKLTESGSNLVLNDLLRLGFLNGWLCIPVSWLPMDSLSWLLLHEVQESFHVVVAFNREQSDFLESLVDLRKGCLVELRTISVFAIVRSVMQAI